MNLLCTALHPMIPALIPGNRLALELDPTGPSIIARATPRILARLREAMLAGALVALGPNVDLDAAQRDIDARFLALITDLDRRQVESVLRRARAG